MQVAMKRLNHHFGSGLSYSSMPSKEWPMVRSVSVSVVWLLRVAQSSHQQPNTVPSTITVTQMLQKVLIVFSPFFPVRAYAFPLRHRRRAGVLPRHWLSCGGRCTPTRRCQGTRPLPVVSEHRVTH